MARHSADVRRSMVLEAAARVIADEGLLSATMRRIAEASQVSLGTVTHHFASVDQLLAEALERESVRFTETLARQSREGSALQRLTALVDAVLPDDAETMRQWRLWIAFWSRAVYEPNLARTHARRYRAWNAIVARLIKAGVQDGSLHNDLNITEATRSLVALIDGVCFQVAVRGGAMTLARAKKLVRQALERLVAG
ncbi:MAG: TetR/AcrR family transcriptional regulator [Deltaproteobacteria bacterium]|nr:TetR/AcrR family transcriptional regulator [Deltaproteobacteria bacterium]